MKSFALLIIPLLALAFGSIPSGRVIISWDYPTSELTTGDVFRVYTSTNALIPLSNWTVMASQGLGRQPGSAGVTLFFSTNQVVPGNHFFFVTMSNFWGESFPSQVVSSPALPRSDRTISISRGD